MTTICCPSCDWTGYSYEANSLTNDQLRALQPGTPVPYGACPLCRTPLIPGQVFATDELHPEFDWNAERPERQNLTQYQRDCLVNLIAKLVPDHPGFLGSNEIAFALRSTIGSEIPIDCPPFNQLTLAPYMQSWVYPLLVGALYGEPYPGHRRHVTDDAAQVRNAVKIKRIAPEQTGSTDELLS
jgi:hypothetical protein